jgi:hypothetical protein
MTTPDADRTVGPLVDDAGMAGSKLAAPPAPPHDPKEVFTILIWGSDRAKFGTPETKYKDARVCVTGKITSFLSGSGARLLNCVPKTPRIQAAETTELWSGCRL